MSVTKEENSIIFSDYPVSKYGKKFEYWLTPEGIQLIAGWRNSGLTIKATCEKMGVDVRTFRSWCKKYSELDDAIKVSKELADTRVVDALYKRAIGYTYDEITRELVEGKLVVTKVVTKTTPPDVKAALEWLYNRNSDKWRRQQEELNPSLPNILAAKDILISIRDKVEEADGIDVDFEEVISDEN